MAHGRSGRAEFWAGTALHHVIETSESKALIVGTECLEAWTASREESLESLSVYVARGIFGAAAVFGLMLLNMVNALQELLRGSAPKWFQPMLFWAAALLRRCRSRARR